MDIHICTAVEKMIITSWVSAPTAQLLVYTHSLALLLLWCLTHFSHRFLAKFIFMTSTYVSRMGTHMWLNTYLASSSCTMHAYTTHTLTYPQCRGNHKLYLSVKNTSCVAGKL